MTFARVRGLLHCPRLPLAPFQTFTRPSDVYKNELSFKDFETFPLLQLKQGRNHTSSPRNCITTMIAADDGLLPPRRSVLPVRRVGLPYTTNQINEGRQICQQPTKDLTLMEQANPDTLSNPLDDLTCYIDQTTASQRSVRIHERAGPRCMFYANNELDLAETQENIKKWSSVAVNLVEYHGRPGRSPPSDPPTTSHGLRIYQCSDQATQVGSFSSGTAALSTDHRNRVRGNISRDSVGSTATRRAARVDHPPSADRLVLSPPASAPSPRTFVRASHTDQPRSRREDEVNNFPPSLRHPAPTFQREPLRSETHAPAMQSSIQRSDDQAVRRPRLSPSPIQQIRDSSLSSRLEESMPAWINETTHPDLVLRAWQDVVNDPNRPRNHPFRWPVGFDQPRDGPWIAETELANRLREQTSLRPLQIEAILRVRRRALQRPLGRPATNTSSGLPRQYTSPYVGAPNRTLATPRHETHAPWNILSPRPSPNSPRPSNHQPPIPPRAFSNVMIGPPSPAGFFRSPYLPSATSPFRSASGSAHAQPRAQVPPSMAPQDEDEDIPYSVTGFVDSLVGMSTENRRALSARLSPADDGNEAQPVRQFTNSPRFLEVRSVLAPFNPNVAEFLQPEPEPVARSRKVNPVIINSRIPIERVATFATAPGTEGKPSHHVAHDRLLTAEQGGLIMSA